MKKMGAVCLAGVFGAAAAAGLAGCGGYKVPNVEGDKAAPAFGADVQATLSIDAKIDEKDEKKKISGELYGVFLEDINYASYALDADLVVNGSFEALSAAKTYGWTTTKATLSTATADGVLASVTEYQAQNVNPTYAKVHVTGTNGGVRNSGYSAQDVPIAVKEGTKYAFSAFVKSEKSANMTVKVTDGADIYLEETVAVGKESGWVKYVREITASGTADSGLYLEITFDATGDYCLDGVRLETEDATVGIKNYIYDAVKALSPKFIRFPGGCITEGDGGNTGTVEVYDWKNSIGAAQNGTNAGDDVLPALSYKLDTDGTAKDAVSHGEPITRTPNIDLWGADKPYYDMTYSLGFFEYFKLCESVGASAVPVLNCGLSCQGGAASNPRALEGRHNKGVEDYIRDAIDLIEFAKGDTSTKWGKIRADMGHPEPFAMNYIGIGNEQRDRYYADFYEKFLADEDFKAALEQYGVKTIVGNGMSIGDCENYDGSGSLGTAQQRAVSLYDDGKIDRVSDFGVHDQHYYVNYTALLTKTDMYDDYSRTPRERYEVFVGEYSANTASANYPQERNEWITALSEAAMMTAYERNGDVVVLAAYAPMFASWGGQRQWPTDMMYFTNTELVLTANYYVQQLFMNNFAGYKPASAELAFADGAKNESAFVSPVNPSASVNIKRLYYTVSADKGGDVIVKLVNACAEPLKLNLAFSNAKLSGLADVTVLQNDDIGATNTLENLSSPAIAPEKFTLGGFGGTTVGYEAPACSVVALRFHTAK